MDDELNKIKSEIALLRLQFNEKIDFLEKRLGTISEENSISTLDTKKDYQVENYSPSSIPKVQYPVIEKSSPKPTSANITNKEKSTKLKVPTQPSFFALLFQSLLSSLFDWATPVIKIYQSYKDKGMLGIFILTIAGIGLTLAGFGYLMQLLIDQLGAGSKSLLMCIVAILVMSLGIVLKVKTKLSEFATAIVTLGILLSYCTVYFSGSVYGIFPNFLILILYLVIALVCHTLALWLDTKVVAALGIIGIATMPILSNTIGIEPLYYLLSLLFVVASSLVLAYRYSWQWLAQLSLVFTMLSVEWVISFEGVDVSTIINVFYLLFFIYAIACLSQNNNEHENNPMKLFVFIAALVAATVLVFFQTTNISETFISLTFALNTLVAMGVSVYFYKIKRELAPMLILLTATWCILTIVSTVSQSYWGIAWAVEGLLLLFIGRRFNMTNTVIQAQIIISIGLVYSWSALAMYFPLPALKSLDGWLLSIIIIAIIAVWQRLINNGDVFNRYTQHTIKPFLQLLEVIWLSILAITSSVIWLGNWTGCLIILLQIALLFRAKACKQTSIDIFAAILIVIPLLFVYKGGEIVSSFRFSLLPLFSQLAMISAFLQLWLWSAFYRKYHPDSPLKSLAESVRILFYLLIPIVWVASVIRRFDEQALMILWLSPLLALFLAIKIKHRFLVTESKILTVVASILFCVFIVQLTFLQSCITLFVFACYYLFAYWLDSKEDNALYQFILSTGIIASGVAIPCLVGSQTDSLNYLMITAALYWGIAFNYVSLTTYLQRIEKLVTFTNIVLLITSWPLMLYLGANYIIVPIIFLLTAIWKKEQRFFNSIIGKSFKLNSDLLLHSIIAISYVMLFATLAKYRFDLLIAPTLAAHGALILFLKDKRLTTVKYAFALIILGIIKLALVDASSALLWQKVVLFMGIGVFMLIASFWYQKLVNNTEALVVENEN